MWYICFGGSVAVLLLTVVFAVCTTYSKKRTILPAVNIMMIGIFLAAALLFVPIYAERFWDDSIILHSFKTAVISILHALQLFILDGDFDVVFGLRPEMGSVFYTLYSVYVAVLYVLSPALTFGVVLSFFKNVSSYRNYLTNYRRDVYIFSKLNAKSLALASSIKTGDKKAVFVFADARANAEETESLLDDARAMQAICFQKTVPAIRLWMHSKRSTMKFFMMGDDETENVRQGLEIIKNYNARENTWLYVFSGTLEGEVLLSSVAPGALKIRRVSDVRALVYALLQSTGPKLFEEAATLDGDENTKLISALVVGMDGHGTEMTKSLAWFGQMAGYRLEITAVDKDENAVQRFAAVCPELMDEKYNNRFEDAGEAQYKITVLSGMDVQTSRFYEEVQKLGTITYVFVDVGEDAENIRTAIQLRIALEKYGMQPRIQAVVQDSERIAVLDGIRNHSGQPYAIDFVGDLQSFYTVGSIIDTALEREALERHLKWGCEEDFWRYEYNYRSSVASALHHRMKVLCGVSGIDKAPAERTEAEKRNLRMTEHRRWNAYMRSEGYTYAATRNNLAKTHPCLVTFDALSPEEQAKDD